MRVRGRERGLGLGLDKGRVDVEAAAVRNFPREGEWSVSETTQCPRKTKREGDRLEQSMTRMRSTSSGTCSQEIGR